jgi:hypothetical protein
MSNVTIAMIILMPTKRQNCNIVAPSESSLLNPMLLKSNRANRVPELERNPQIDQAPQQSYHSPLLASRALYFGQIENAALCREESISHVVSNDR